MGEAGMMGGKEEAAMLRLNEDQPTLWESVLPPELFVMSEELIEVDRLLDDERFFAPFKERFNTRMGRPTVPVATYLRMMYLKRRYGLGYEMLVREVKDSFTWRRFCRLSLEERVPDSSTLIKLSHKYGEDTVRELNDALVRKLKEKKVVTRTVSRLKKLVHGVGKGFVDHTRKVKKSLLALSKVLKNRVTRTNPALVKAKKEIIEVAEEVVAAARVVQQQLGALETRPSPVRRLAEQLDGCLEITGKVLEQTREVLAGRVHLKDRLVSIFDPGARPIRKGKARAETEFGRKVLIGETDHGIITTYEVCEGNPSDIGLLGALYDLTILFFCLLVCILLRLQFLLKTGYLALQSSFFLQEPFTSIENIVAAYTSLPLKAGYDMSGFAEYRIS